jgi:hypothetical protein
MLVNMAIVGPIFLVCVAGWVMEAARVVFCRSVLGGFGFVLEGFLKGFWVGCVGLRIYCYNTGNYSIDEVVNETPSGSLKVGRPGSISG